jgi:hypothetical protein
MLETCMRNLTDLTGDRRLADDRLASSSMQVAKDALSRLSQK